MEVTVKNGTFFQDLERRANNKYIARKVCLANTQQNEPEFQKNQNLSRNYMRTGDAKYADPFSFHMRPNNFEYDGRKLQIQETLFYTQEKDYPDVTTKHPLKVVGFY
jgi:hypothetical protein